MARTEHEREPDPAHRRAQSRAVKPVARCSGSSLVARAGCWGSVLGADLPTTRTEPRATKLHQVVSQCRQLVAQVLRVRKFRANRGSVGRCGIDVMYFVSGGALVRRAQSTDRRAFVIDSDRENEFLENRMRSPLCPFVSDDSNPRDRRSDRQSGGSEHGARDRGAHARRPSANSSARRRHGGGCDHNARRTEPVDRESARGPAAAP